MEANHNSDDTTTTAKSAKCFQEQKQKIQENTATMSLRPESLWVGLKHVQTLDSTCSTDARRRYV